MSLHEPPPLERERGAVLTAWLAFFGIANLLSVVRSLESGQFLTLVWSIFGVVCAVGVWRWYRLAYYGMFLGFAFNLALALDNASSIGVMFQLVYAGLTYALVQPKKDYLR